MKRWDRPCCRCGGTRENPALSYCRACRAAYQRAYRAAGREPPLTAAEQLRYRVRHSTLRKLRRWGIEPAKCMVCGHGFGRIEVHHPSYIGPRASWLVCTVHPLCHRLIHEGRAAQPPEVDLADVHYDGSPWFRDRQNGSSSGSS